MIILCACNSARISTNIYEQIYEKYNHIENYQSKIRMTIISNKTDKNYVMYQYYKFPNKYRFEILEPEEIEGLVTVYSGNDVEMIYPQIKGKFTLPNYQPVDKSYIFLPGFFEAYYKSEQTSVVTKILTDSDESDDQVTVLSADIPGNNMYRFSQSIWIDTETLLPIKMEIYDLSNKLVISIIYDEIAFDVELEDKMFDIQTGGH